MVEVTNPLKEAVQKEARTRPSLGGKGTGPRQEKLNSELGLGRDLQNARKRFDDGEISLEQYLEIVKGK